MDKVVSRQVESDKMTYIALVSLSRMQPWLHHPAISQETVSFQCYRTTRAGLHETRERDSTSSPTCQNHRSAKRVYYGSSQHCDKLVVFRNLKCILSIFGFGQH